ncbi:hypothetical protein [Clostridium algidicarnis]|uniref:hypothetical protein n=1 Tax=Clostridium algidicarnis TaxID=37659 RepID=UPI003FD83F33
MSMLDLSMFNEETYDIKFSEDDILHVKKPSEDIAIKILAHVNIKMDEINPEQMLKVTRELTKVVLNHNKDTRVFNDNFIKKLPLDIQMAILKGYTQFMIGLEQNPN